VLHVDNGDELQASICAISEQKLPGVYLLLVHPEVNVRLWATKMAKLLGKIKTMNDFTIIFPVIERFMSILLLYWDSFSFYSFLTIEW
jgi:hypothetical protein